MSIDASAPISTVAAAACITMAFFVFLALRHWLPEAYFYAWSDETIFVDHYKINTPEKFWGAAVFVFINTAIATYVGQVHGAWQVNCVNDQKTRRSAIPNSDLVVHLTIQTNYLYTQVSRTMSIYFLFTNVYFILIQTLAGSLVLVLTTHRFLKLKEDAACGDDDPLVETQWVPNTRAPHARYGRVNL